MSKIEDTELYCEECQRQVPARIVWLSWNSFEIESFGEDGHEDHHLDVR